VLKVQGNASRVVNRPGDEKAPPVGRWQVNERPRRQAGPRSYFNEAAL
jgi:hypothetical protein